MKRISATLLLVLLWSALACAQQTHITGGVAPGDWPTKPTLTCTKTSGTAYSTDIFFDTLTGNTTYTLPTNATGCIGRDHIEIWITQGTNQSFTVTILPGTGNVLTFSTIPGAPATATTTVGIQNWLQIPPSTGGATNVTLHEIWVRSQALAQWDMVLQETNPAPQNAEISSCYQVGATGDVKMNNAIAALPNGGIVNARCFGFSTQTEATEVALPSQIPFVLLIDKATTFNTTIVNATKATFHLQGQSTIRGDGVTGVAGGFGITLANTASVIAEIYMDGVAGISSSVENIGLNGNSTATVAKGLLYANQIGNISNISGVQTTANGSPLMFNLLDITGPLALLNDYADCGSIAGTCTPLKISDDNGGVGTNNIVIQGGVYAHEGGGGDCAEIDVIDAGANNTGIIIDGITMESAHTCAIGANLVRAVDSQVRASGCSSAGADGNTCVKISGGNDVTVEDLKMYNNWTNTVSNIAVTPNVNITKAATPDLGYYLYQGFAEPNGFRVDAGNNQAMTYDVNGLQAHLVGFNKVYSAAGVAIPACAAAIKNTWAFVSDSTACTSGTTYTSGGGTCCLLQCNNAGNAWKETGTNCF